MNEFERAELIKLASSNHAGIIYGSGMDFKYDACFYGFNSTFKTGNETTITYLYRTIYPTSFILYYLTKIFRKVWEISLEHIGEVSTTDEYIHLLQLDLKESSLWVPREVRLNLFYYTLLIVRLFDREFCLNKNLIANGSNLAFKSLINSLPTPTHYVLAVASIKNSSNGCSGHFIHDSLWDLIQCISKNQPRNMYISDTLSYPSCVWSFLDGIFEVLRSKKHLKLALQSCKYSLKNTALSNALSEQFDRKRKEV